MSVTIKSEHEIELMREAGRILSIVHQDEKDHSSGDLYDGH